MTEPRVREQCLEVEVVQFGKLLLTRCIHLQGCLPTVQIVLGIQESWRHGLRRRDRANSKRSQRGGNKAQSKTNSEGHLAPGSFVDHTLVRSNWEAKGSNNLPHQHLRLPNAPDAYARSCQR